MARPAGHRLNAAAFDDIVRRSGKTLAEIAERSDVPRVTLSSLLGGHHKASPQMANRIALAAGVQVETLFPSLLPGFVTVDTEDEIARKQQAKRRAA